MIALMTFTLFINISIVVLFLFANLKLLVLRHCRRCKHYLEIKFEKKEDISKIESSKTYEPTKITEVIMG